MCRVRSELDFVWNVALGFVRPDNAFSIHILQREVAEIFNTWAVFRYDKTSLISIITLSLISKNGLFCAPFSECMLER